MREGDRVFATALGQSGLVYGEIIGPGRLRDWTVRWDNGYVADEHEDDIEVAREEEET